MNRFVGEVLGAGLALTLAAGCGGEEATKQEAQITGFARAIDAKIVEDQWVRYTGESSMPRGAVLLDEREEFTGCREVETGFLELGFDDQECWFRLDCDPEEGEHCEAQFDEVYDYEVLREGIVEECPAPIRQVEFKREEPFIDQACVDRAEGDQRVRKTSRFIIWVQTPNPKYDAEKPNGEPQILTSMQDISAEEWQTVTRETKVTAYVRGDRVTRVEIDD